jgi:dCMP deaminase
VQHHGFHQLRIPPAAENGSDELYASLNGAELPPKGSPRRAQDGSRSSLTDMQFATSPRSTSFRTSDQMLDFVTKRWRERWVTTDILNTEDLDSFSRRPFFLLISVDAPVTVRWRRSVLRGKPGAVSGVDEDAAKPEKQAEALDAFVTRSDAQLYDVEDGQLPLMSRASVRLLNTSSDIARLFATLGKLDLLNEDRLRPSWDTYFMALASLAAQRSNCMKRRVGCVLAREKRVISTGYNGTPRGLQNCGQGGCGRCNEGHSSGVGLATCLCLHAEENALLEAGRERIRDGTILYCDTCPCLTCSIKIAQVGISEVVYSQGYSMDQETARVLREAGVKLRQFVPVSQTGAQLSSMTILTGS